MSRLARIELESLAATRRVARTLAASLPANATVAIDGDLGAGKTTFVKSLAAAVGLDPAEVTSPTFGIVHVHDVPPDPAAPRPPRLVHVDAYRLAGASELGSIGWADLEEGPGWLVVEWAERLGGSLPANRLTLSLEVVGEDSRRLLVSSPGPPYDRVVEALLAP
jgi:tRNA threonylcarbamoyladenosine biosynthesis protein TsaE